MPEADPAGKGDPLPPDRTTKNQRLLQAWQLVRGVLVATDVVASTHGNEPLAVAVAARGFVVLGDIAVSWVASRRSR